MQQDAGIRQGIAHALLAGGNMGAWYWAKGAILQIRAPEAGDRRVVSAIAMLEQLPGLTQG